MSFPATVFRVLIASPSDVTEEREIAVRTIQEWNDRNAAERHVAFLPLRWETHSTPQYGQRPQEILNSQIVDRCDLLVGVFWTRIGSETGKADSGTVEEIERVAAAGKPVMIYFSRVKRDPGALDLDQLSKLRAFESKIKPLALVEHYDDHVEFRDKLSRHIEAQLKTLLGEIGERPPAAQSGTDIVLHFADPVSGGDLGPEITLETTVISVADFETVPDYSEPDPEDKKTKKDGTNLFALRTALSDAVNRDYYRQTIVRFIADQYFKPFRFWLQNRGALGARDVHLEVQVSSGTEFIFQLQSAIPSRPSTGRYTGLMGFGTASASKPEDVIGTSGREWTTPMDVGALQPQRVLAPQTTWVAGAGESCTLSVRVSIYADTLPEPSVQELKINLKVQKVAVTAQQLLDGLGLRKKGAASGG